MNKKGNMYMAIVMALMLFMVGMIAANFLREPITDARLGLNCDNEGSITDGTKLLCLNVDMVMVYFIILVVSIAGGVILDRIVL